MATDIRIGLISAELGRASMLNAELRDNMQEALAEMAQLRRENSELKQRIARLERWRIQTMPPLWTGDPPYDIDNKN